jgi:hypothetical protein
MPPDREKLSAAVQSRGDRILAGEVAIAGALEAGAGNPPPPSEAVESVEVLSAVAVAGNRASRSGEAARALLEDHRGGAVKRGSRVAVAVRAVRV